MNVPCTRQQESIHNWGTFLVYSIQDSKVVSKNVPMIPQKSAKLILTQKLPKNQPQICGKKKSLENQPQKVIRSTMSMISVTASRNNLYNCPQKRSQLLRIRSSAWSSKNQMKDRNAASKVIWTHMCYACFLSFQLLPSLCNFQLENPCFENTSLLPEFTA